MKGSLIGKPAAVFTSSNTQHGGQEITILSTHLTVTPRLCYSWLALLFHRANDDGRDNRRLTIWSFDNHWRGTTIHTYAITKELQLAKDLGRHLTAIANKLLT